MEALYYYANVNISIQHRRIAQHHPYDEDDWLYLLSTSICNVNYPDMLSVNHTFRLLLMGGL